jgi:phosphoglycerol transferase MdoB-like AlkP superfamily enzyme
VPRALGPLLYIANLFGAILLVLGVSRACLAWAFFGRVGAVAGWGEMFVVGTRIDLVTASFVAVPPALALLAMPSAWVRRSRRLFELYFASALVLVIVMEAVTFDFIREYDNRPNRIFVEYLGGSKEVAGTLWSQYHWQLLAVVAVAAAGFVASWKIARRTLREPAKWHWGRRSFAAAITTPVLFLGARGTLDHRPVNPSTAAFSGDNLLNQLALNSTYSVVYAAYSARQDRSTADLYGRMGENEIRSRVAKYTHFESAAPQPGDVPFLHVQEPATRLERPRNLVIVLEESLGAEFVGCLGGLPLTPNFDALSREGLLLTNLYSTGTRTVRGIESTVCGFLPTPANSVVKLSRSQSEFFTIAALLKEHGYARDFIYGGESQFDNMAAFLLGNGFERALDETDYEKPAFHGTWGVSDEDLMRKAHELFLAHGDRPFFALVLSTSNHSPFEFPLGRFDLYEEGPYTRNNAMKYADYAIGELFRLAKTADYYKNTIWVVVADHNTRVYGDDLIPVSKFHIPGLLIGPDVEPGRFAPVASQIDLMPTALHLLGIATEHPMVGRDLFGVDPSDPGCAVLQYYDAHGLLVGDRIAIHAGSSPARCFRYAGERLVAEPLEPEFVRDGLAYALLPGLLYEQRRYRLAPRAGK